MRLSAEHITLVKDKTILDNISFIVAAGELVAVVGQSGSGKSSLLKVLSGFEKEHVGNVTRPKRLSYIAQDAQLLPWLSVKENILLPTKIRGATCVDQEIKWQKSKEILEVLHLEMLADAMPETLSGGMKQCVLLAQALLNKPELILFDEALSAVDYKHKYEIAAWLRRYAKSLNISIVLVTHDLQEALTLADKVFVLNALGTLERAYAVEPTDRFTPDTLTKTQQNLWQKL